LLEKLINQSAMTRFFKQLLFCFIFGFWVGIVLYNYSNSEFNSNDNSIILVNSLRGGGRKYPRNFDKNFHRILKKGFPDFQRRVEYEEAQLKLYNSARLKLYRAPYTLTMEDKMKSLTPEERDAINYFTGQGFYRDQQHFKTQPNIFDTRESFLIKMHDEETRNRFLKSLKESD
jgi:hypothetical protein